MNIGSHISLQAAVYIFAAEEIDIDELCSWSCIWSARAGFGRTLTAAECMDSADEFEVEGAAAAEAEIRVG